MIKPIWRSRKFWTLIGVILAVLIDRFTNIGIPQWIVVAGLVYIIGLGMEDIANGKK